MGNPQHLEWLLEGVMAWNARRERQEFTPDLSGMNIFKAFDDAGKLDEFGRIPLQGVDLEEADLTGTNLEKADLSVAELSHSDLIEANLHGASLMGADLAFANLDGADLDQADLFEANLQYTMLQHTSLKRANLWRADLRGAVFWDTNLRGANLTAADVRSFPAHFQPLRMSRVTDLSNTKWLLQSQLEVLRGDRDTIIPVRLSLPEHWPEYDPSPELGEPSTGGEDVVINSGRVGLAAASLPERSDLHTLFDDLAEEVEDIARAGNFNNISTLLDTAFSRFRRICQSGFETLDEVRFGVQIDKLDTQFRASRADMAAYAPDREGAVEAMLIGARLIAARLPKFKAFLAEQTPNEGAVAEHFAEVGEALAQVAEALAQDTAHFEPELAARMKEYWETASIKAYLAGAALLNNVVHKVFSGVRRVVKGLASEGEKLVYKGIAIAILTGIGKKLAVLAHLLPAEFSWVSAWLQFLKTLKP